MSIARRPSLLCLTCQWRTFSTTHSRLAEKASNNVGTAGVVATEAKAKSTATATATAKSTAPSPPPSPETVPPPPPPPLPHAPRSYGKKVTEFTPTPLSRPIGLPYPPEPGQNTGIDNRTLKQRRDDFVNYKKHLAKREQLYGSPLPLSPFPFTVLTMESPPPPPPNFGASCSRSLPPPPNPPDNNMNTAQERKPNRTGHR